MKEAVDEAREPPGFRGRHVLEKNAMEKQTGWKAHVFIRNFLHIMTVLENGKKRRIFILRCG